MQFPLSSSALFPHNWKWIGREMIFMFGYVYVYQFSSWKRHRRQRDKEFFLDFEYKNYSTVVIISGDDTSSIWKIPDVPSRTTSIWMQYVAKGHEPIMR